MADPGADSPDLEERAAFLLGLRERGIRDLTVLRAMEAVRRADFVPAAHAGLAHRDVALPLPFGEICPAPWTAARLLQGAGLQRDHRVLEIGTGTGYFTALLSQIAAEVVSVERYAPVATRTGERLAALGIGNATVTLAGTVDWPRRGTFDRVFINSASDAVPEAIWALVAAGGAAVFARWAASKRGSQLLVRASRDQGGQVSEIALGPVRFAPEQFTAFGLSQELSNYS